MKRWVRPAIAGLVVCGLSLAALGWTASAILAGRRAELDREARVALRQFGGRLRHTLERHLLALEQFAAFEQNSQHVTAGEFTAFAGLTLDRLPRCLRICYVDASGRITRVHPLEPNRFVLGFDTRTHAAGHAAIGRALHEGRPVFSPPLRILGGQPGFLLVVPVMRNTAPSGAIVGTYVNAAFAAALAQPEVGRRYDQVALISGIPVDDAGIDLLRSTREAGSVAESFELGGVAWEARVRIRPEVARAALRSGMPAFWILGGLVSLLLGGAAGGAAAWLAAVRGRLHSQGESLRATRERLDGALKQLLHAEKMTALGELVAGVAHEINNPLASIMGYTQLALAQDLPDTLRKRLETVCGEAERMARIVKNLLTFARKHPPEKIRENLNAVVERTLELKAYHLRVNQIRVEKDLAADLPPSHMDPHQMQQVLINLINNAEQALAERGRGGIIRLSTRARDDGIELRIADDGPGVPEAIQEKIFEPFFTTKKEGKGTGLGLSLCYGIVQGHGGAIRVESRPGEGAAFVIELPLAEGAGAAAGRRDGAAAPGRHLSILVIDPEQSVSRFLVDLLTSRGHRVTTAAGVAEALARIATPGLDVIISDLAVFEDPARDFYRELRQRNPDLQRRVIFTTGEGSSGEALEFIRRTGNAILHKPCRIEDLEGAIARAIAS
jgi:signal transduction histidine kinase